MAKIGSDQEIRERVRDRYAAAALSVVSGSAASCCGPADGPQTSCCGPSDALSAISDGEEGDIFGAAHLLTWLVFGYTEDFDLWLQMPLTLDEANDLVDGGPLRMDRYVASKPGRPVTLVTYGDRPESLTSFAIPVPSDAKGVMWLLEAMVAHLERRRRELELIRVPNKEVKEDLRAISAVLAAV